jgi:hypothetical protein
MQIETYLLPSHWASALVNGDVTGYEEDDLNAIILFTDAMVRCHGRCWCVNVDEEESFTHYHDARRYGVLACNCTEFTFDVVN